MSTRSTPAPPAEAPPGGPEGPGRRPRRRRLDARTVAICVSLALVLAIAAGLVTSIVLGDDDADAGGTASGAASDLELTRGPEPARLLASPLVAVDGSPTSLGDQLGDRPMVVNIWAQSCVPCVREMPLLEQAHQDNPDIDVFGVDTQDQLAEAMVLARKTGITYPWAQDPDGTFFYEAKGAGMPTTLLVAPSGRVLASRTGAFSDQDELQRWLDDHLG